MLLGVTGLARVGKDAFADFLVRNYSFTKLNLSDCLRDELIKTGKEPTKGNMCILGDEWRAKWGYDIVIRRTLERAQKSSRVVITGLRSVEEVEFMRSGSNDFQLVAIVASDETRFSRKTSDDPQDFESFIGRDRRDIEKKGLDKVLALADHVIDNDSGGWEIHKKAAELMRTLGSL